MIELVDTCTVMVVTNKQGSRCECSCGFEGPLRETEEEAELDAAIHELETKELP